MASANMASACGTILLVFPLLTAAATKPALPYGKMDDASFSNYIVSEGHRLSRSPLRKINLKSFFDCLIECAADMRCLSTNVNTTRNAQGLLDCELLATEKYLPENSLAKVEGIDHYALPVACNCFNGGTCVKSESRFLCTCAPGYLGGNCQSKIPRNCAEVHAAGFTKDGVYTVDPDGRGKFQVFCDMTTDGGGWAVMFKRSTDFTVSFNRMWEAYKNGFGNISQGEFWLGNEHTHRLTAANASTLRVELESTNGLKYFAKYSTFRISAESDFYRLHVSGFSGTAGDAFNYHLQNHPTWVSNGMKFSTPDKDNDLLPTGNCGVESGWWYNWCSASRMTLPSAIEWRGLSNFNMKKVSMKFRPKGL